TDNELVALEAKQLEADDQAIQTILMGLLEDIYATVDSCNSAMDIWLRVQQMMKGTDIGVQKKEAKLHNELERFTSTEGKSIESYYHPRMETICHSFSSNKATSLCGLHLVVRLLEIESEGDRCKWLEEIVGISLDSVLGKMKGIRLGTMQDRLQGIIMGIMQCIMHGIRLGRMLFRIRNGNGNVVATRAWGNGNGNNANQIRCYDCRGVGHYVKNYTVRPRRRDIEEVNANCILMANLQQASTSGTHVDKAHVYDLNGLAKITDPPVVYDSEETLKLAQESRLKMKQLDKEIKPENYEKINQLLKEEIASIVNQVDVRVIHFEKEFLKEAAKFVRDFKSLANEADESLDKIKVLEKENELLLRAVVSQDIMSIVQNLSIIDT
ncbi:hypothetical protein Tco_0337752, partial [Tanacetum coccineum]